MSDFGIRCVRLGIDTCSTGRFLSQECPMQFENFVRGDGSVLAETNPGRGVHCIGATQLLIGRRVGRSEAGAMERG